MLDNQDPFEEPLARIVAADAEHAGIEVVAHDSIATAPGSVFTGEVEKIAASGAQAVFLAGDPGQGTAALWRALYSADPQLWLLGSSTLVNQEFTTLIGAASGRTMLTTPLLPIGLYSASAQGVLARYRQAFAVAGEPEALYGYEAMSVVLESIRRAGLQGNDRQDVIESFFATRDRHSVIGTYSMQPDGETTLTRYAIDRVVGGRAVFYRVTGTG